MASLAHLSIKQQELLFEDLYYLTMPQLRGWCEHFKLPKTGKKVFLIDLLKHYLQTGELLVKPVIPSVSRAKRGLPLELRPDAHILYGSYKNDLRTRLFLKSLVGKHFHYTAHGIDWINERWMEGKPPTYKEFARFWQKEYEARKINKRPPKKEWKLINFALGYAQKHPNASRDQVMQVWKDEQADAARRVQTIFSSL